MTLSPGDMARVLMPVCLYPDRPVNEKHIDSMMHTGYITPDRAVVTVLRVETREFFAKIEEKLVGTPARFAQVVAADGVGWTFADNLEKV